MIRSTPTPGAFTVIEKKKNSSREGKKEREAKSTNVRFNVTVYMYLYALMACIINMTTTERNIRW